MGLRLTPGWGGSTPGPPASRHGLPYSRQQSPCSRSGRASLRAERVAGLASTEGTQRGEATGTRPRPDNFSCWDWAEGGLAACNRSQVRDAAGRASCSDAGPGHCLSSGAHSSTSRTASAFPSATQETNVCLAGGPWPGDRVLGGLCEPRQVRAHSVVTPPPTLDQQNLQTRSLVQGPEQHLGQGSRPGQGSGIGGAPGDVRGRGLRDWLGPR